jgi:polyisoprenoid-binding protein YceI
MYRITFATAAAALVFAAPFAAAQTARGLSADPAAAPAGAYTLDKKHTSLVARVNHLGFSNFTMRFNGLAGTLDYDPKDPTRSKVDVTVDPNSVDTGLPDFDKDIAAQVFGGSPIRFVSTKIERAGDGAGRVVGDLTFHGVTRPVTLETKFNGTGPGVGGKPRVGFSAVGTFKRSDFGADKYSQYAADEVQLQIEAEFSK